MSMDLKRKYHCITNLALVSVDGGGADPDPGEHRLEEVDGALRLGEDERLVARRAHIVLVQEVDQLVQLKEERADLIRQGLRISDIFLDLTLVWQLPTGH